PPKRGPVRVELGLLLELAPRETESGKAQAEKRERARFGDAGDVAVNDIGHNRKWYETRLPRSGGIRESVISSLPTRLGDTQRIEKSSRKPGVGQRIDTIDVIRIKNQAWPHDRGP